MNTEHRCCIAAFPAQQPPAPPPRNIGSIVAFPPRNKATIQQYFPHGRVSPLRFLFRFQNNIDGKSVGNKINDMYIPLLHKPAYVLKRKVCLFIDNVDIWFNFYMTYREFNCRFHLIYVKGMSYHAVPCKNLF